MAFESRPNHWADATAMRIIKQLGEKEEYTLASGITPSGTVHFGNFREVITTELVARGLRKKGKKVRFIFSWDDYDTFRKIPKNMPKQEELEKYLFQPIVDTPDPFEKEESYARHHQVNFENELKQVGIEISPVYQANQYRNGAYKNQIITTLKNTDKIKAILNKHRSNELPLNWLPVNVYCSNCNRDKMKEITFDGENILNYTCELCNHSGQEDILNSSRVKLPWRMDWPMRWSYEKVDFEPGGKDHSSEGGSYTTAKEIVKEVYNYQPPIYLQYDFVSIKGAGGKMSSSSGNLITVTDVLNVYTPEMVRWIFASYKSNVDFAVSFDLDVIKTYEDFDRLERVVYEIDPSNEKKRAVAVRVYELSQLNDVIPEKLAFRPPFRHLTNVLQINGGNIDKTRKHYEKELKTQEDIDSFNNRAKRANYWVANYAPEEFKFSLREKRAQLDFSGEEKNFISKLHCSLEEKWNSFECDKDLHELIYKEINDQEELEPSRAFLILYTLLINKEKGPKLASFIRTIGKDKALELI